MVPPTIKHADLRKIHHPFSPNLNFEIPLWQSGMTYIGGLDEAGRGAWAGPVSAAVVVLPVDTDLPKSLYGVRDSKQMTPTQRANWSVKIKETALAWGVGLASHVEIDTLGIVPATRLAMARAIEQLAVTPQHLLIDALRLPQLMIPQTPLIKGDQRSLSIAAASVLAKTARDTLMVQMDSDYPGYGFSRHKGYGTAFHRTALAELGVSPVHRISFSPVKSLVRV
jgi:ribonuclease HII